MWTPGCEPLDEELPAVLSHVSLALQEHKLNFQQWSSTVLFSYFEAIFLIFDRAMTYLSRLLISLLIGTHETKDNVSGVHLSKLLT